VWSLADLHLTALTQRPCCGPEAVSWCAVELTKNVAEIGQLRLIRASLI
jgi:hypothetical protein